MASTWGNSWGTSWLTSWDGEYAPPPEGTGKVGGDDVPERYEVIERRVKPKRKDEELNTVLREAMDKAMGRVKPTPVVAKPFIEDDEEDDIEALLMVL